MSIAAVALAVASAAAVEIADDAENVIVPALSSYVLDKPVEATKAALAKSTTASDPTSAFQFASVDAGDALST